MTHFKTDYQLEKEAKDKQIYDEYVALSSEPGAAITKVNEYLMKKYNIHSPSTLWSIRKRVEKKPRKRGE